MRRTSSYAVADKKNDNESELPSDPDATLKRFRNLRVSGKQRAENSAEQAEIEEHESGDTPAELVSDRLLKKNVQLDKDSTQRRPQYLRRFSEPGKVLMSTGQTSQRFHRSQSEVDQTMLNKQILQERGGQFMSGVIYCTEYTYSCKQTER
jgi:hypothetical protein